MWMKSILHNGYFITHIAFAGSGWRNCVEICNLKFKKPTTVVLWGEQPIYRIIHRNDLVELTPKETHRIKLLFSGNGIYE